MYVNGKKRDVSNAIGPVRHEPLTTSTLDEIQSRQHLPLQDGTRLGAVGEYQAIKETLQRAIADLKVRGDADFDMDLQDKAFSKSLLKRLPAVAGYVRGKSGATMHDAQYGLARQWASFSDPNKPDLTGHYDGPANHASVSLAASAQALDTLRTRYADAYRTAVAGHDADPARTAWTAATAIQPEQWARWE